MNLDIQEPKHKLDYVIRKQNSSARVVSMLDQLVEGIARGLKPDTAELSFRTHIYGLTGMVNDKKAFVYIDLRHDFISMVFFVGRSQIDGLGSATGAVDHNGWGSTRWQVRDQESLAKAIAFACAAHRIAKQWCARVQP